MICVNVEDSGKDYIVNVLHDEVEMLRVLVRNCSVIYGFYPTVNTTSSAEFSTPSKAKAYAADLVRRVVGQQTLNSLYSTLFP